MEERFDFLWRGKLPGVGFGHSFDDFLDLPAPDVEVALDRLVDQLGAVAVHGLGELVEQHEAIIVDTEADRFWHGTTLVVVNRYHNIT